MHRRRRAALVGCTLLSLIALSWLPIFMASVGRSPPHFPQPKKNYQNSNEVVASLWQIIEGDVPCPADPSLMAGFVQAQKMKLLRQLELSKVGSSASSPLGDLVRSHKYEYYMRYICSKRWAANHTTTTELPPTTVATATLAERAHSTLGSEFGYLVTQPPYKVSEYVNLRDKVKHPSDARTVFRWRNWWESVRNDPQKLRMFRWEHAGGSGLMPTANYGRADRRWEFVCQLHLLHTKLCTRLETFEECGARLGWGRVEMTLPRVCRNSTFWKARIAPLVEREKEEGKNVEGLLDYAGVVPESWWVDSRQQAKPPSPRRVVTDEWPPAALQHFPWYNDNGQSFCHVQSLPYSVPEELVVPHVERDKIFDFSPLLPSPFPNFAWTYQITASELEPFGMEMHARSYFAATHRRGGWACQRHLEQLAAGTIPYFLDIDERPEGELTGFPAELLQRALDLPGLERLKDEPSWIVHDTSDSYRSISRQFARPGSIDHEFFDKEKYFKLADELLNFTREKLTTTSVAGYFLRTMNATGRAMPKRVLAFTRKATFEVTGLYHGLARLGVEIVHGPTSGESYEWAKAKQRPTKDIHEFLDRYHPRIVRGHGWGFGSRMDPEMLSHCSHEGHGVGPDCCELLARDNFKHFDMVIYGFFNSISRNWWADEDNEGKIFPCFPDVARHFRVDRVAMICGDDDSRGYDNLGFHMYRPDEEARRQLCSTARLFAMKRTWHRGAAWTRQEVNQARSAILQRIIEHRMEEYAKSMERVAQGAREGRGGGRWWGGGHPQRDIEYHRQMGLSRIDQEQQDEERWRAQRATVDLNRIDSGHRSIDNWFNKEMRHRQIEAIRMDMDELFSMRKISDRLKAHRVNAERFHNEEEHYRHQAQKTMTPELRGTTFTEGKEEEEKRVVEDIAKRFEEIGHKLGQMKI